MENTMRKFLLLVLLVISLPTLAEKNQKKEWQASTLSDSTIANIQKAKYEYLTCITQEVKKKSKIKMDTRAATDLVLKECEKNLVNISTTFKKENIPSSMSDRYIKKTRTQTARKVLQEFIYAAAAKQ
jgi:hypothetical protein